MCPTAGEDPERDSENWGQLHHEVVNAAYEIIKLKGYTSWGIGIMSAKLADAILKNQVGQRCRPGDAPCSAQMSDVLCTAIFWFTAK